MSPLSQSQCDAAQRWADELSGPLHEVEDLARAWMRHPPWAPWSRSKALAKLNTAVCQTVDVLVQIPLELGEKVERLCFWIIHNFREESFAAAPELRVRAWDLVTLCPPLALLWIAHPSGVVREVCLDAIAMPLPSPYLYYAVRQRINDWAEPVRQAARRCVSRCLPLTSLETVAAAEWVLLIGEMASQRWRRDDHGTQPGSEAWARPGLAETLAHRVSFAAHGPQARWLELALLRGPELEPYLEEIARGAAQPQVRCAAYRIMLRGTARILSRRRCTWGQDFWMGRKTFIEERNLARRYDLQSVLSSCAEDASAAVRKLCVADIIQRRDYGPASQALAGRLLHDRSPAVRLRAEFIVGKAQSPGLS